MRENKKIMNALVILLFCTELLFAAAPEQKEKYNHQANLEAAQSHVDFLLENLEEYPKGIGYSPAKSFDTFQERVATVDKVFESHSAEADKRDRYFDSSNAVKPIYKYFVGVINQFETTFVDINGRKSTEADRAAYLKRKFPGVKYDTLKKFLVTNEKAQKLHAKKDGIFWNDLSEKKQGLVSIWPENSNAIHPKLSAEEFKKYLPSFPKDKDCSIKKVEDFEKEGVKHLRIFVEPNTFFEVRADSLAVQTPYNRGYEQGISTPFSIELGLAQWMDEGAVMRFDKDGKLKEIRISKPGKEINTDWISSVGSILSTGSMKNLAMKEVDKKISYRCKVDPDSEQGQMSKSTAKSLQDGNRTEGKEIPSGDVIRDPTLG
ncbi:MAG: hypothetical protein ACJARO_001490, partial [Bacteriovoracaceae bacterium]